MRPKVTFLDDDLKLRIIDEARHIPVEFVPMPLSGFMAPVTLVGSLIQRTTETLSGVVSSRMASPGAPVLSGGSPAIFDVRCETTPMGAVVTQMIDCAYSSYTPSRLPDNVKAALERLMTAEARRFGVDALPGRD